MIPRARGLLRGAGLVLVSAGLSAGGPFVHPAQAGDGGEGSDARTGGTDRLDAEARVPATEVRLAPSAARGVLGAWLVAGPFRSAPFVPGARSALDTPPAPMGLVGLVDERSLAPTAGSVLGGARDLGGGKVRPPARWSIVAAGGPAQDPGPEGSRTIDLKASLEDASTGKDLVAYAAGRLHVERAGRYYLLLAVDDGVRVSVDGVAVFTRDEARPVRDDDDIVALDLAAGDHDVVLKLHQREGAWAFRVRLVDETLTPPAGAYLALPGTTAEDARSLAARMSWLVVDRAFDAVHSSPPRYRPTLTVRYPDGVPRGIPLPVSVRLGNGAPPLFELQAGGVVVGANGASDLLVTLPPVEPWTGTLSLESTVAGRVVRSTLVARPLSEQALARADRALARTTGEEPWLAPGSLDSIRYLTRRLERLVARGDSDGDAQAEEAKELDRLAANLERGVDPYEGRTGMMRRAIVTPFDAAPSELGLYVPPMYRPGDGKAYPLVIGLHGLNSYPMSMMRALFGQDDEKKEAAWKDRHPVPLPPVDAFVITPYAHGNTMYREIGEDDVLWLTQWASKVFPIDAARITVTGPSMGGIGAASIPLHFPHVFAAAAPLCGYHSYLIRADIAPRAKRPWERLLLEERSNVMWAENGEHLPLWIVHGTRDLPEANSGVLIDRYTKLGYSVKHEHPDAGHNVWGLTYGGLKGFQWLLGQRLDPHPAHVKLRTMRPRYGTSAWVSVTELASESGWAEVDARVKSRSAITLTTSGVAALTLRRDDRLVDPRAPVTVDVDGVALAFSEDEALVLHRSAVTGATRATWAKGAAAHAGVVKTGHVSGPIRDVFHEPLTFVYAADAEARANERVARAFADRPGVPTGYPVMSDAEFIARNEPLANERALFLVGRTNKVLQALELIAPLPIHVDAGAVRIGAQRIAGREVGAAFVYPNPARGDRYVVVVAGADVGGTLRALSLPDLLPDFAVWDEGVAPARGQLLLGSGTLRAAGLFRNDWSLPPTWADPLAKVPRAPPPGVLRTEPEPAPELP